MTKKSKRPLAKQRPAKAEISSREKLPLVEHLKELKRRLFYVAACVAVGAAVTYGLERRLIEVLLRPANGQDFIYTSPMGGMNFLFSVCLDAGLIVATPVIIYQILAFVQPLMRGTSRRFLVLASATTGFVAVLGVLFGFFIGLPQALHFLLHQFVTDQVKPLITIQSYVQFVAVYLLGSALMFQLPLILLFINRIKPLKPKDLFKYERHLIVVAFVIAFIMNPSPKILDQMLVVVPIILTYQLGIVLVWLANRGKDPEWIAELRAQDVERQAERINRPLVPYIAADPLPVDLELSPEPILDDGEPTMYPIDPQAVSRPYATVTTPPRRNYLPLRRQATQ
jgi:sec-independent protein translocase protein TatC